MVDLANPSADAPGATEARATPLARLDPRARLLVALAFALVVVSLSSLATLLTALGLALGLLLLARPPLGATLRRLAALDGFMLLVLLVLPFSIPGTPVLTLGGLSASLEGLRQAIAILLKANSIVMVLWAATTGLDAVGLGHALGRLGMPSKLVQLLFFTVRYIGVIGEELERLRTAMRARAFRPTNDRHTYRSLGYLIGMLLVRSLERSERILAAMRCRGFVGVFHVLDRGTLGWRDALFGMLAALLMIALLAWDLSRASLV